MACIDQTCSIRCFQLHRFWVQLTLSEILPKYGSCMSRLGNQVGYTQLSHTVRLTGVWCLFEASLSKC